MIDALSPPTRRIVAVGLLVLAILLALQLFVLPVTALIGTSLDALAASRERLARTAAIASRPPLPTSQPLPPGLTIAAASGARAQVALAVHLRSIAGRAGLAGLDVAPLALPVPGQRIAARVGALGPAAAIMTLVQEIERSRPVMRFAAWEIMAVDGQAGQLRLAGTLEAAWAPRR